MQNDKGLTVAQRKKQLIAHGAVYRHALSESVSATHRNLQGERLAQHVLDRLRSTISAALGHGWSLKAIGNGNLQTVIPLVVSAVSVFAKRPGIVKPALITGMMLAATTMIASIVFKNKFGTPRTNIPPAQGADPDG